MTCTSHTKKKRKKEKQNRGKFFIAYMLSILIPWDSIDPSLLLSLNVFYIVLFGLNPSRRSFPTEHSLERAEPRERLALFMGWAHRCTIWWSALNGQSNHRTRVFWGQLCWYGASRLPSQFRPSCRPNLSPANWASRMQGEPLIDAFDMEIVLTVRQQSNHFLVLQHTQADSALRGGESLLIFNVHIRLPEDECREGGDDRRVKSSLWRLHSGVACPGQWAQGLRGCPAPCPAVEEPRCEYVEEGPEDYYYRKQ